MTSLKRSCTSQTSSAVSEGTNLPSPWVPLIVASVCTVGGRVFEEILAENCFVSTEIRLTAPAIRGIPTLRRSVLASTSPPLALKIEGPKDCCVLCVYVHELCCVIPVAFQRIFFFYFFIFFDSPYLYVHISEVVADHTAVEAFDSVLPCFNSTLKSGLFHRMYKKHVTVSSTQLLGGKDVKKLRSDVLKSVTISDADLNSLLPAKAAVNLWKLSNRSLVYALEEGNPLFFDVNGKGDKLYPTVSCKGEPKCLKLHCVGPAAATAYSRFKTSQYS
jgi:hypothetical protein